MGQGKERRTKYSNYQCGVTGFKVTASSAVEGNRTFHKRTHRKKLPYGYLAIVHYIWLDNDQVEQVQHNDQVENMQQQPVPRKIKPKRFSPCGISLRSKLFWRFLLSRRKRAANGLRNATHENSSSSEEESPHVEIGSQSSSSLSAEEKSITGPKKLFVTDLPPNTVKEDLESFFGEAGNIVDIRCPKLKRGQMKFAFVEFDSAKSAEKGLGLDCKALKGKFITIEIAQA